MIPFDELPKVPVWVAGIITPRCLTVRSPRVAYYFGATVDARGESEKRSYATSYILEWAHAFAAALTLDHVMCNRVWVCDGRCDKFLRKLISCEDFVVDVVVHEVSQASFRRLVSLLEKALSLSHSFRESYRISVCAVSVVEGCSSW